MDLLKSLVIILFSSVLINNYVLNRFLGICPFLGVSKNLDQATGMGISVTAVMLLATAVTWPIQHFVLDTLGLQYMQTIVFILVIASLVQFVEIVLKKYIPALYRSLGIYLPLITTNCAVLGVTMLVLDKAAADPSYTFLSAIVNTLGTGVGYLLAMVLFAGVRERLEDADIPKALKGLPITLIAAAIVALSFLGFGGITDGLM